MHKQTDYPYAIVVSALRFAAEQAYKNEVVDTGMEPVLIGEDLEFSSKEEWIAERIEDYLVSAEGENKRPDPLRWHVIDRWGGNRVVALCAEEHFARAITSRFPTGYKIQETDEYGNDIK